MSEGIWFPHPVISNPPIITIVQRNLFIVYFIFLYLWFNIVTQILAVEQDKSNDSTTDGCICKVEYRAEEDEVFSTYERHPSGPVCINYREVEHIHDFSIQTFGITFSHGYKRGNGTMSAFAEYETIEHTVDDIADCSSQYQWYTNDVPGLVLLSANEVVLVKLPYWLFFDSDK